MKKMRLPKKRSTEKPTEAYLVKRIAEMGGKAYKYPAAGGKGMPYTGEIGMPDRICILPFGCIFMVECKDSLQGAVSAVQKERITELRSLGVRVYVARDKGQVDYIISQEQLHHALVL